jgi:hypothetical protein
VLKHSIFVLCSIVIAEVGLSQSNEAVVSQTASVSLLPVYQRWTSGGTELFSETSIALSLYQPISRQASFGVHGSFASASGNTPTLRGFNDVQLTASYYLEPADLIFGLGLNLPTGKSKLSLDEFSTSYLVSNTAFRAPVPQFGAGLNVSPSATWAFSFSDDVVGGLGALYQYRGKFVPIAGVGDFDPGDEVSFTAGMDFRLDLSASLSFDAVLSLYAKDKLDGLVIFNPGNKLITALRFKKYFEQDELNVTAILRTRSNANVPAPLLLLQANERVDPNQYELIVSYAWHASEVVTMHVFADGRISEETQADFSGIRMIGAGLMPLFTVNDNISLPVRVKITTGKVKGDASLLGIEAALGLVMTY